MRLNEITVTVPIREKKSTADGHGKEWVTVGSRNARVEIDLDWTSVKALAHKAANNKSKRSKSGPIVCKAQFI